MKPTFDKRIYVAIGLAPVITFFAGWIVKSILRMPDDLMGFVHAISAFIK